MSRQTVAPITKALLTLCARPQGFRNAPQDRDDLRRATGREYKSSDISPRLRRLEERGCVTTVRRIDQRMMCMGFTITARGRQVLASSDRQRADGKPNASRIQLGTWAKAPKEGRITLGMPTYRQVAVIGIAKGYDQRYQCGPDFKGGEFSKLGIGRYVE